jgi:hypothetical protein
VVPPEAHNTVDRPAAKPLLNGTSDRNDRSRTIGSRRPVNRPPHDALGRSAPLSSLAGQTCNVIPNIERADSVYFGRPASAFCRTGQARALEIWIDPRSLNDPDCGLLVSLAGHESVDIFTTSDVPGAMTVKTVAHEASDTAAATWTQASNTITQRGGLLSAQRRTAERLAERLGLHDDSLLQTAMLASVAQARNADAFITDARCVEVLQRGTNAMAVSEAVSLVGLFLRNLDDYIAALEPKRSYDRSTFWWLLSRDLLPAWGPAWRDFGDQADAGRFPHTNGLGFATLQRLGQALRYRDRTHAELQGQPDGGSGEEAIQAFDVLLLCLDAAFDAGARVFSSRYNLGNEEAARWRSKGFVKKLGTAEPTFEPLLNEGGLIADATTLLGTLRKTVHGSPLQAVGYESSTERNGTRMVVTTETLKEVERIALSRGGLAAWGLDVSFPDMPLVDLHYFVEMMTPFAIDALDAMIRAAVGSTPAADRTGDWDDTPDVRRQMRLLAGVEHWGKHP